jgi:hypothetical protein
MIIFGGIDGTGVWNNDKYAETFEHGFVRTLCRSWTAGPCNYERGPVTADNKPSNYTYFAALRTYRHVLSNWRAGQSAVFLAGYSRGGAAVIEVAKWLRDKRIPVECLILFDPVDRTGQVGLPWRDTPIVDTARRVIYAKRAPCAKSRRSFGNCGLKMWNGQRTPYKEFFATHGGLGGLPWPEPETGGFINEGPPDFETRVTGAMDRAGASAVQQWTFNQVMDALHECQEPARRTG